MTKVATKPKSKKAPVKKMTETKIKEYLTEQDYEDVEVDLVFEVDKEEGNGEVKVDIKGELDGDDEVYLAGFNVSEYTHCCGIREIGEICLFDRNIIPDTLYTDILTKMLRKTVNELTNKDNGRKIALSFSVPIDDENSFGLFIEAALKVGFREIGEFVNLNSTNTVKHFMNI